MNEDYSGRFQVLYLISGESLVSFHVPLSKALDDRGNLASMWVSVNLERIENGERDREFRAQIGGC